MIALLELSVGTVLFALFVYQLSRSVLLGWYCLLFVTLFNISFGLAQSAIIGLHLDPADLILIGLFSAGIIRFANRIRERSNARLLILAYLAVFSISLARGVLLFGLATSSNEGRGLIGEVLGMLYFFTIPTDTLTIKKFLQAFLWYGSALVAVAALHYLGINIGSSISDEKNRALPSVGAEVIALCFFIGVGWSTYRRASKVLTYLLPVFAGTVIVLQHRSVWVVMLVCLVSTAFLDRKMLRRMIPLALLAGMTALCLALAIYGTKDEVSTQLVDSATNQGTWQWRVEAWRQSLSDEDQTFTSALIGQPIGFGFVRFDSTTGGYENLPPHSEFVLQYLRVGILGLVPFLGFLVRPILVLPRLRQHSNFFLFPSLSVWYLLVIGIIVYGVPYGYNTEIFALVGVANAQLRSTKQYTTESWHVQPLGMLAEGSLSRSETRPPAVPLF